jgi:rhamnogalacturonan endolyase
MDAEVQAYVDGIAPELRPLFDRLHRLIMAALPEASPVLSFTLTAAQAATDRTLRIGITTAKAGGRPQITVNDAWTSAIPAAATEPSTRTLTVGSYRGNNHTYEYVIPAVHLVTGTNTLRVDAASGSAGGGGYLSPSYGFDALDLL